MLGSAVSDDVTSATPSTHVPTPAAVPVAAVEAPQYEQLAIGQSLEWAADTSLDIVERQVGPMVLHITKKMDGELAAPVLRLTAADQEVTLEGSMAQPGLTHRITLMANRAGAAPIIMLQSYSGGAHCCDDIQLAGFSNGKLTSIKLGSWDGEFIDTPSDLNGDGVADFVLRDDRFLYAFSSYASSYAPPQILNVVNGKAVNVSTRSSFKTLFADSMRDSEAACVAGASGDQRNGACPAYVATAARLGVLEQAWPKMIGAYDASATTYLPTGCRVKTTDDCPESEQIIFKSYPEALLNFLQQAGYISKSWVPPEFRHVDADDDDDVLMSSNSMM